MNTQQFVERIGGHLSAVMAAQSTVEAEIEQAVQTGQQRLQALRDEAANLQSLLSAMDGLSRETVEALLSDGTPVAAAPQAQAKEAVAPPAAGTAPARPRRAAAEPVPPPPVIEACAKPEAHGLKDADAKMLIVMRAHLNADGVCMMKLATIAKLAGIPKEGAYQQVIKRLRAAGIISPTKEDPSLYTVADRGQRLPLRPVEKREAVSAPVATPAPPSQPAAARGQISADDTAVDAKVLDIIRRADASGCQLHDMSVLSARAGISILGIGRSIERLAAAGRIKWTKSLPGHVAFEVLDSAEVAV